MDDLAIHPILSVPLSSLPSALTYYSVILSCLVLMRQKFYTNAVENEMNWFILFYLCVALGRYVKRETLKLIEIFLDKDKDQQQIGKQCVPLMTDPMLGDFSRNVPNAKESEVLSLFATIINNGVGPFYGYGKKSARGFHNDSVCSISDYQSMDNRLFMEIQSIELCPKLMVGALFLIPWWVGSWVTVQKVDDDIDGLISDLGNKYHEQVSRKTSVLNKLLKTTTEAKAHQGKESKQDSVDKHMVLAYQNVTPPF
ncbi:zinc finger, CCHC-type containing protein [Tanacetum coccineum]